MLIDVKAYRCAKIYDRAFDYKSVPINVLECTCVYVISMCLCFSLFVFRP